MNKLLGCAGCVLVLMGVVASPASAAFPGRDGLLAVQPLTGRGVVLVDARAGQERRICTDHARCGSPRHPRWSPDGRTLAFSASSVHVIYADGSCLNCAIGGGGTPAFTAKSSLLTLVSGGKLIEDGIDGILKTTVVGEKLSDAVWSSRGKLAVVRKGRVWAGSLQRLRLIGPGSAPSWSPGGSKLAIQRHGWVLVIGVGDRSVRRLVPGSAPAWSPNGKSIAFFGAHHHLLIVSASGGRPRRVGRVRGVAVDWQPRPVKRACLAPPGSKVLASSPTAVVTGDSNSASTAALGCLRADGRVRFLEHLGSVPGISSTGISTAAVGDHYAALANTSQDLHYGGYSDTVVVFDLRTGAPVPGRGGESTSCSDQLVSEACVSPPAIDQVVVGAGGVTAAHVTTALPPGSGSAPLVGISCPSASLCVAVDGVGGVFTSTDPTGGAGTWTVTRGPRLAAVSCPSVSLCVGVANPDLVSGSLVSAIYTSTNPSGGAGTWTPTYAITGYALSAVACPSASLCVAVNARGNVITSTNPTGGPGAWTTTDVDGTNPLSAVSCPSVSLCVATDDTGHVITSGNPTGGAGAWNVADAVATGHVGPESISCPSSTLCVGVGSGSAFTSTNPAAGAPWTQTRLAGGAQAVDCPSTSLCLAVGAGGSLEVSTSPTAGTWTSVTIDTQRQLQSIACASSSLCVAGDGLGHLVASSNPTGGSAAWIPALVDGSPCADGTACTTEAIVAGDSTGLHTLDAAAHPGPGGSSLTALNLSGLALSWLDAGARRTATLH